MSLEENIRGLGEPIPGKNLDDWRMLRPDGKIAVLGEKDLLFLWWWKIFYPDTNEKRQRIPFSPDFENELKRLSREAGFTLKTTAGHLAKMGYENRAFLYEFDARITGKFRFEVPFFLLKPELREYIATLEAKHRQAGWTDPQNLFVEFASRKKHGNAVPRKQPHPWHIIEAKDRSIFLKTTLSDTERSFWSKLKREAYEPYSKVIYSELAVT